MVRIQGCCQSSAVPIDFHHCPKVKKPGRTACQQDWTNNNEEQRKLKLSMQGSERLTELKYALDKQGVADKQLVVSVDGTYTNAEVLKHLPERVTQIGRIRKSISPEELKRYIKVKGRSGDDGSVMLSENEMNRLSQLGEAAW